MMCCFIDSDTTSGNYDFMTDLSIMTDSSNCFNTILQVQFILVKFSKFQDSNFKIKTWETWCASLALTFTYQCTFSPNFMPIAPTQQILHRETNFFTSWPLTAPKRRPAWIGLIGKSPEVATGGVLLKKVFLVTSKNSQENNCARDSFLIKLLGWALQLY